MWILITFSKRNKMETIKRKFKAGTTHKQFLEWVAWAKPTYGKYISHAVL